MPSSIGEQIVLAMVAALNAPSNKPATCYRNRADAFAAGVELPAFALYTVDQKNERKSQNEILCRRLVALECLVAGQPPQDAAADPLYVYAVKTLYADATLTALIRGLDNPEIVWQTEPGESDVCIARLQFEIAFTQRTDDPTLSQ